jgi:hypothetical protein
MRCENNRPPRPIVAPACFDGKATRLLKITYHDGAVGGSDTLRLCEACCKLIAKDARCHGYRTRSPKLS